MLEGAPLGTLKRVRIGHDDSGPASGWFLDKVRGTKSLAFQGKPCLHKTRQNSLWQTTSDKPLSWSSSRLEKCRLDSQVTVEDMETRKVYEFPCGRWLAKNEDDGQTQRDLMCGVGPQDAPPGASLVSRLPCRSAIKADPVMSVSCGWWRPIGFAQSLEYRYRFHFCLLFDAKNRERYYLCWWCVCMFACDP